jgi:hypothetical protein
VGIAVLAWSKQGRDIVVCFDNDQKAADPKRMLFGFIPAPLRNREGRAPTYRMCVEKFREPRRPWPVELKKVGGSRRI